jgi:hypothetical protein
MVNKLRTMGSLLGKKRQKTWCVLSEDTPGDTGEVSPINIFRKVITGDQCVEVICTCTHKIASLKTIQIYTCAKTLRGRPCSESMICNCFCQAVCNDVIHQLPTHFTEDAWFYFNGHVNTQHRRHWAADNPRLTNKLLLCNVTVGVWCSISVTSINGPTFWDTMNSERYNKQMFAPFLKNLSHEVRGYGSFQQDATTTHTACNSVVALWNLSGDQRVSQLLGPTHSPNLIPVTTNLSGSFKGMRIKSIHTHTHRWTYRSSGG